MVVCHYFTTTITVTTIAHYHTLAVIISAMLSRTLAHRVRRTLTGLNDCDVLRYWLLFSDT